MSRNRFDEVKRYIHFCNNQDLDQGDRFAKIRLILDTMKLNFSRVFELGGGISFDEGTWATKSRYAPSKQFNPMKPHKWGWKLFMTCCATTGYCYNFEMYQGKHNPEDGEALAKERTAGPMALYRNVKHLAGSGRTIYCDRYYTSVALFIMLLNIGLYAVGTIRTDSSGFPQTIIKKKKDKCERGDLEALVTQVQVAGENIGTLIASCWVDTKPVHLISTAYGLEPTTVRRRIRGGNVIDIPTIEPYEKYGQGMGGVDLHDFLRMSRYSLQSTLNFRKWYRACFAASLDMILVNAFLLWKHSKPKSQQLSHGEFLERLSNEMVSFHAPSISRSLTRSLSTTNPRINHEANSSAQLFKYDKSVHSICSISPGKGYAGAKRDQKRCSLPGCTRSTSHYCTSCCLPFCVQLRCNERAPVICFDVAHGDPLIWEKITKKVSKKQIQEQQMSEAEKRKQRRESNTVIRRRKHMINTPTHVAKTLRF